jgi:PAS domain S-box-containing protein
MTLRRKILIGYLVFIALFVAANAWSAYRLHAMADVSRRIIADNYVSVVAAEDMKERLERQDDAAAFLLLKRKSEALTQLQRNRAEFDAALQRAAGNVTEPGEANVVASIKSERDEYYRLVDDFWGRAEVTPDDPVVQNAYFTSIQPAFERLRAKCQELLEINQTAMRAKSQAAERVAREWFVSTVIADVVLLVAAVWLAFVLSRLLVRPLNELRNTTTRIAGGDLDARVDIRSHDEIGMLGAEFNRMAERIRQLRRTDLGQVILAQQTTEAAIDSMSDPVVVTDSEGHVTKLNHAAEEIFGREAEQAGKSLGDIARDSRVGAAVSETLQSQRAVDLAGAAGVVLPTGGADHTYHLRATPMRDDDGHLLGAVTLLEDITQARERDRAKSEFIDSATKHLREPLTNVELGLHLVLEGKAGELNEKQTEVLQSCREDCARVEDLLRDLGELSRVESGEEPPHQVRIDPSQLLTSIGDGLRPLAEAKRIALVVSAAVNLPMLRADRVQIGRVINELAENAIRQTPAGGETGVSARLQDGQVVFEVSNTGEAIPPEYLDRIFERFVRVPGSVAGGSGLGLNLVKKLVEQNGGQITLQSERGRGTTFTVTLPVTG